MLYLIFFFFFFSSRRRHTRWTGDWSSDVCSSDLHDPGPARRRAFGLLQKMAENVSAAPGDPAVINAEIDELLEGDIPYFSTFVREGRLHGPGGTYWLPPCDLVEAALADWRNADFALEQK